MGSATVELLSIDQFLALPDSGDYELIDGELRERCMAFEPAWVAARFTAELYQFTAASEQGLDRTLPRSDRARGHETRG